MFILQCLQFHPNSNYIATGSCDRTVRMWDCLTGTQVRIMTGHKVSMFFFKYVLTNIYQYLLGCLPQLKKILGLV